MTPGARGNWGLPMCFWGDPGISKTDRIEAVARTCGLPCEVLSPGERGEAAFGVIPVPREIEEIITDDNGDPVLWPETCPNPSLRGQPKTHKTYVIDNPKPSWCMKFDDSDGAGVVFCDELTTAPPAIQPAELGLIHARRIGAHFLGKRVRVIGAANPVQSAAGGYDLPPPVANRLGHFNWPAPDVDAWIQWLTTSGDSKEKFGNALAQEEAVMERWATQFSWAKGCVAGFLRARRSKEGHNHLFHMPKANSPDLSRAWPSPRTWELATRALAGSKIHNLTEEEEMPAFVSAFVGEGPAIELLAYMREMDLPMPEDVLDGKVPFKHEPLRLDRTMAVISACTAFLSPPKAPKRKERADKMWEIVGSLLNKADDIGVLAIYALSNAQLHTLPSATSVLLGYRPVLTSAGIGRGAR